MNKAERRKVAYQKIDELMSRDGLVPYETKELSPMPDGIIPIIAGHPDLSWSDGQKTAAIGY